VSRVDPAVGVSGGRDVRVEGAGLRGVSEGSSGHTRASPADVAIVTWTPLDYGIPHAGVTRDVTPTSLVWSAPVTPYAGPGFLSITVGGARGAPVALRVLPAPLGVACREDTDCGSGHCVGFLCCDSACTAPCVACSAARKGRGEDGLCEPVLAQRDSDGLCPADPPSTCGRTGLCGEGGRCAVYAEGASCGTGSHCAAGTCVSDVAGCDDDGTVHAADGARTSCAPFRCSGVTLACFTQCMSNLECVDGATCGLDAACHTSAGGGGAASTDGSSCAAGSGRTRAAEGRRLGVLCAAAALVGVAAWRRGRRRRSAQ
jgi:hypothetical protein